MIERQEIGAGRRDSLARWIRDDGSERYVPATTMCLWPRKPHRLRIVRPGFEAVIRCGDCPGCRELDALRLQRRFAKTYAERSADGRVLTKESTLSSPLGCLGSPVRLFAVRVYCPREIHATLIRQMHRWRGVNIEPGFVLAGVESFIVVSSSPAELKLRLGRRRLRLDVRPIGNPTRARSWRHVARGLIVARSAYGENINRFYRRGLARLEKLDWEVEKIANYQTYHRGESPRVISEERGRLVPPEMWKLQRGVRVRLHNIYVRATSPESVDYIVPEVRALISRVGRSLVVSAVPKTPEELERSRRAYQHVARLESARTEDPIDRISSPPFLKGEVTEVLANSSSPIVAPASSIHASGAPPPPSRDSIRAEAAEAEARETRRAESLALRAKKKTAEAIERLRKHIEEK